jgi:hypothetical protein
MIKYLDISGLIKEKENSKRNMNISRGI